MNVAYAAGFYEGEGSVDAHGGSLRVTFPQKDRQPLDYIRRYFGGSLSGPDGLGMFYLYLHGKRGWDFLVAASPYLSDRRIAQVMSAYAKVEALAGREVVLRG